MQGRAGVAKSVGQHTGRPLIRHPVPQPTSSLLGYVLKVSQANGFSSPWNLVCRAGLEQHEIRGTGIRVEKIAAITNCQVADLRALGYSDPHSKHSCLLGHRLYPTDLNLRSPRICPECIQDRGFIEAHWDLMFMIGCPVHACRAVSLCFACGEPIRWFRQGLLRCHCGERFQSNPLVPIGLPECDLLQIIRTKVPRLLPLADFGTGLPIPELQRLELRSLLAIIAVLGCCSIIPDSICQGHNRAEVLVAAAAKTLSIWPTNFFKMLELLGSRTSGTPHDVRDQFAPLYSSLFKRKLSARPEDLDFLRIAFLDFVSNHWDGRMVDIRTLKRVRDQVSTRYVPRAELARSLGVDPRTVKRHSDLRQLPMEKRSHSTLLVDRSQFGFADGSPYKILAIRQAAREIGISVAVLRSIKDTEEFEVRYQLHRQPGFHEYDVRSFKDKVLALVPGELR
jgi:hypothetical protein